MNKLEFEVGKFYKTRSGLKAECVYIIKNKKYGKIFYIKEGDKDYVVNVSDEGFSLFGTHNKNDYDIVSEWKEKKKFFKAVDGEKSWQIAEAGGVMSCARWCGDENKYGLAFETKEELEKHMEYLEAAQKLKERIFELNDNEFPEWDWEDEDEKKFYIYKEGKYLNTTVAFFNKFFDSWFYLKTAEARYRLLKEMPEELMIFLSQ